MKRKPQKPTAQTPDEVNGRDTFQTPNYAVDLLVPFLKTADVVWECATGLGKIERRLGAFGFKTIGTDLVHEDADRQINFLFDIVPFNFDCIVTNPPFSIKKGFLHRCLEYGKPFALLVPADYAQWSIEAVRDFGCEKIVPSRRIDFVTPNVLNRIREGEVWRASGLKEQGVKFSDFQEYIKNVNSKIMETYADVGNYSSIFDVPSELLAEYSSSFFHSLWLTWGLNIGRTETFVELSLSSKKTNV